jgi:hypothetical protein
LTRGRLKKDAKNTESCHCRDAPQAPEFLTDVWGQPACFSPVFERSALPVVWYRVARGLFPNRQALDLLWRLQSGAGWAEERATCRGDDQVGDRRIIST